MTWVQTSPNVLTLPERTDIYGPPRLPFPERRMTVPIQSSMGVVGTFMGDVPVSAIIGRSFKAAGSFSNGVSAVRASIEVDGTYSNPADSQLARHIQLDLPWTHVVDGQTFLSGPQRFSPPSWISVQAPGGGSKVSGNVAFSWVGNHLRGRFPDQTMHPGDGTTKARDILIDFEADPSHLFIKRVTVTATLDTFKKGHRVDTTTVRWNQPMNEPLWITADWDATGGPPAIGNYPGGGRM